MKKIIVILLMLSGNMLYSDDKFSVGLTAGYQYDVGMLSEKPGVQSDVQQNISAGLLLKLDMSRLFFRSGIEYSYPFEKGKIAGNSAGEIKKTSIVFTEVPVYAGISLPLRDFGAFYLGGGGSYIFGSGHLKTESDNVRISEQLFGYGLIAGIEYEIYSNASFVFEWEYMAAKSSPVASFSGSYDDYCVDYTGQRIRFGIVYNFSRY